MIETDISTDTTFITNEGERTLLDRFRVLIKDTRFFDVLVGYFYTSGFYALYESLETTEKVRILIGINTDKQTSSMINQAPYTAIPAQGGLDFSHAEAKEVFSNSVENEMENSADDSKVERGVSKFMEWLQSGKLEIKAYPSENIHAKLYIMTFVEGDKDIGRIITGSSNFTQAGLVDNLEFNVELKNRADYDFAQAKFNELWGNAVDVSDKYIETVHNRTWLNNSITPYELYLKFLYEYLMEKINIDNEERENSYRPKDSFDLKYQKEAVVDAKNKLLQYGGVFISDVVGLGKTYVSAMLAGQLDGRNLVIAPPTLLDENNPGSWPNVFSDFRVAADFESLGKLDHLIKRGTDKYQNIFIDEAHRFRSEMNITYEKLAQICRGKRVILVTATPLNNSPNDILSQIKLFQKARKSTIPNLPDLERFFGRLKKRLNNLDRQQDYDKYMAVVAANAQEVREKILKYLMVRRTRSEIVKYFSSDLGKKGFNFPEVADPQPVYYQLNANEDHVFNRTIELVTRQFNYARYTPMLYYEGNVSQPEKLAQHNMRKFMRILLVKRLESSSHAFRNTVIRFIESYKRFIQEFDNGNVYISKKYANRLFELLEYGDNDEDVQRLIDEDKARRYDAADFNSKLKEELKNDLAALEMIKQLWQTINRDPKLLTFIDILKSEKILKKNKLIIFTESRETAEYLDEQLSKVFPREILSFSGASGVAIRNKVIANFDARAKVPEDDYRILITTEVLSEGVNLHRSNVVINYDIPWNPTRLMQRVGRINRVDTKFDTIYAFNFFPTTQSNDQLKLEEAAEYKIQSFIEMLGNDARLLTEGEEIKSHDLFTRLMSKRTLTGEDEDEESELKYLQIIRNIRDNDPDLFEKIKRLPKKARTARDYQSETNTLLTYFRKGKLQKFYLSGDNSTEELDFFATARHLEANKDTPRRSPGTDYYELLEKNKAAFTLTTTEEVPLVKRKGGRDSATFVLKILKSKQIKSFRGYTEDDELYIREVIKLIEEGGLPKQTTKTLVKELSKEANPLRILGKLKTSIPIEFFKEPISEISAQTSGPREVILSEYLIGK